MKPSKAYRLPFIREKLTLPRPRGDRRRGNGMRPLRRWRGITNAAQIVPLDGPRDNRTEALGEVLMGRKGRRQTVLRPLAPGPSIVR